MASLATRTLVLAALAAAAVAVGAPATCRSQQGPQNPPGPDPAFQRDLPTLSGFTVVPFDFGPPGARSLGMGGTFIALADDATAAEANPAGLTQLSRPEMSIHGRHSETTIETFDLNALAALGQLNRQRTFLTPLSNNSTVGNAFATETHVRFQPEVDEVSFASFVKPSDTYTFSIFYQKATNFSGEGRFTAFDDSLLDLYETRQVLDLQLENFGLSAAFEAGNLSVGFSIRYSHLEATAFQDLRISYGADLEFATLQPGANVDQVRALPILDERVMREDFEDEDSDITFSAGLLWKPTRRFSMGLVYKDGGSFGVEGESLDFGCVVENPGPGDACEPGERTNTNQRFQVPDALGAGIAIGLTDRLKVAIDVVAIGYSEINPVASPGDNEEVRRELEPIDDEMEVHFGLEQIFLIGRRNVPFTVRVGAYSDPDHDGVVSIDSSDTVYTLGFGTVIGEKLQIDVAAKSSDNSEAGILSLVYRF